MLSRGFLLPGLFTTEFHYGSERLLFFEQFNIVAMLGQLDPSLISRSLFAE